jgi:hypothetical protein
VARWSSSLKYSRVRASTEKCVNTFCQLCWGIDLLRPWLIMGMGIYNNNTIVPSFYANPEVRYANHLSTAQAYNTNVVDRSYVAMSVSSSHVNMHNSYSSTDISRWSNHNGYIAGHVSNIHNGFMPSHSSTELASHCTLQTHMPMSNCYSQADMRGSADFGLSLYTTSIQLEWRLHQIWFYHHLLCLAHFIQLHLFIAELKKVQQARPPLVPIGLTSTRAPTPS